MSTPANEPAARKHYTTAEIEAELALASPLTDQMTCEDLCFELQGDIDALQNLEDYPLNQRARVAQALRRDMAAVNQELRQRGCPEC